MELTESPKETFAGDKMGEKLENMLKAGYKHGSGGIWYSAKSLIQQKKFFSYAADNLDAFPKTAFYQMDKRREFHFKANVESLDVMLLDSKFECKFSIFLRWTPTFDEVRAALQDGEWICKAPIEFRNNLGDNVGDLWTYDLAFFPEFNGGIWVVIGKLQSVKMEFQETFELESFPFDVQDLDIRLRGQNAEHAVFKPDGLLSDPVTVLVSRFSETDWVFENIMCEFTSTTPASSHDGKSYGCIHLHLKISRRWQHYFYRIISILAICSLTGVLGFAFDMEEEWTDACGYVSTCLLTVIAFMFVVSSTFPPIPYLTFLDCYVIVTIGYVGVLFLLLGLFRTNANLEANDVFLGSLIAWFAIQIGFFIASCWLSRKERRKINMERAELEALYPDKDNFFLKQEQCITDGKQTSV